MRTRISKVRPVACSRTRVSSSVRNAQPERNLISERIRVEQNRIRIGMYLRYKALSIQSVVNENHYAYVKHHG